MCRLFFLLVLAFGFWGQGLAQSSGISVSVSADTLSLGDYIEVRYTLENLQVHWNAKEFPGFDIVGGPNTSSRMSIINGEVSRSATYSYFLKPKTAGVHTIEALVFESEGKQYQSSPMQIVVLGTGENRAPAKSSKRNTIRL
jgi:hypothetical protein